MENQQLLLIEPINNKLIEKKIIQLENSIDQINQMFTLIDVKLTTLIQKK